MIRGRGERRGEIFRIIGRDPDSTRRSFCPPSRIVASEIRERFGGSSALGEREECACLGWLEDKSWPRGGGRGSADMEKLPLGVSLAKAVADNGGESVLRKRLVAWNNGYLMRTGCTGNRWRVTSEKREWTWSPLSSSLFFSRDVSVILARQIIHWGKSRSTRNERDDTNAGQGRGGEVVWWWSTRRLTRRKQGWDEDDVSFAEMAFEDFCLILRCLLGRKSVQSGGLEGEIWRIRREWDGFLFGIRGSLKFWKIRSSFWIKMINISIIKSIIIIIK